METNSKETKRSRGIEAYFTPIPKKKPATVAATVAIKETTKPVIKTTEQKDTAKSIVVDSDIELAKGTVLTTSSSTETASPEELFYALSSELQTTLELEYKTIHPSWLSALASEFKKPYFLKLKKFLLAEYEAKKTIFPTPDNIYSWSKFTPYDEVKVVILGQDPYHNVNQAHGLSFSVLPGVAKPPSLRNIFKEVKSEYPDFKEPDNGYLGGWASQGVLLLNAALTVQAHKPNSHANQGWETFTDAIINHLSKQSRHIVFMLWGAYAQKKGSSVDSKNHLVLKSPHPSPFAARHGFFDNNHFLKANSYLVAEGKEPIEWTKLSTPPPR